MRVAGRAGRAGSGVRAAAAAGAPGAPGGDRDGDAGAGGAAGVAVRGRRAAPRRAVGGVGPVGGRPAGRLGDRQRHAGADGPGAADGDRGGREAPGAGRRRRRDLKHAAGHAPGKGKGQLPPWAAHGPSGAASGTFKAPAPVRGVQRGDEHARSRRRPRRPVGAVQERRRVLHPQGVVRAGELPDGVRVVGADRRDPGAGVRRPLAGEGELGGCELRRRGQRQLAGRGGERRRVAAGVVLAGRGGERGGVGVRVVGDLPGDPAAART